ncbi:hypothetical protein [Bifidobacterium platyrrhinorum]|uniref:Uncharacterized protein n=1 Tax=Bifidobacterium platyrrhinorum TaxID=2661628 RepID=A0A6L9SYG7_9BIFI|nr:hypothetical protein [Bifidobacterium platyrrhinorum]NEG56161.1 hypothetical protein [Bifidobacterium platyrrhinorum]
MGRFNPEMSNDRYLVDYKLTGNAGSPYEFSLWFRIDDREFEIKDLSMGDMVDLNKGIAGAIRQARKAKRDMDYKTAVRRRRETSSNAD